ncbi:MAG: GIDE domain-containing protein [Steroidobacterales bacterium]
MPSDNQWLMLAALLAGAGAYGFWFGFKSLSKSRAIQNTPTSRIRSAAQGYAEFTGVGALPPRVTIKGPLTGLQCAWWHYQIQERGGIGPRNGWLTVDTLTSETPFLLDDGTGQCLVDPRGAEVVSHVRTVWYGATRWPEYRLPPGAGFLGKLFDALMSRGRYRYMERRLNVDEPLYALGEFRTSGEIGVSDPEDRIAQVLHEWKANQAQLLERFDANHDGKIDAAEWDQVRAAARAQVLAIHKAHELEPTAPVLTDPGDGRAFLLAASDHASLARRFRLRAIAGIGGFVACVAALAWMLRAFA